MTAENDCRCRLHDDGGSSATWDGSDRKLVSDVLEHAWHVVNVFGSGDDLASWSYTVGLMHSFGVPDLVMVALEPGGMHYWLNETVSLLGNGRRLSDGDDLHGVLEGYALRVRDVAPGWAEPLFGLNRWFSRSTEPPMQQLVWPDQQHRMPWDEDASEGCRVRQARLWLSIEDHPTGVWTEWANEPMP